MKKIYLAILLALFLKNGIGQVKIDSLWAVYHNKADIDTNRLKALYLIAWSYNRNNPDTAILLAKQQIEFANAIPNGKGKKWLAKGYITTGVSFMNKGDYPKAIEYYFKGLQISKEIGDKKGIGNCYNNIGIIYSNQGNLSKALEYYMKVAQIREETGDKKGMASCYNNIGVVYQYQSNFPKALEYYLKTLKIVEHTDDKQSITASYTNIGNIYQYQSNFPKALEYFFKALKVNETDGDKKIIAACYTNIGLVYYKQLNIKKALEYYLKALKINEEIGDKKGLGACYASLGTVYSAQFDFKEALKCHLKSLQITREIGDKIGIGLCFINLSLVYNSLSDYGHAIQYGDSAVKISKEIGELERERLAYESLATAYSKTGRYKEAYESHKKFKQLTDSVFNAENSKQLGDLKTQFEVEKKEAELKIKAEEQKAAQDKKDIIQQEKIKRQKIINWSITGLLALTLLSSFLLFNRMRLKQKNKDQLLVNEKQKELAVAVMDTQEQERKRIAEDLHDSLGHLLSTVKFNLQTVPEGQKQYVENSLQLLKQASEELQNITFNLMPRTLEEEGLVAALNELASKVSHSGSVKVQVQVHNMERFDLEKQSQFNIYRIVQEAVNNILKHAEAKEINIQLIGQATHFSIMIEDDGKGFDTGMQKNGRGLKNIVTRSLWLKGNINIDSTPGHGTTITTEIPV